MILLPRKHYFYPVKTWTLPDSCVGTKVASVLFEKTLDISSIHCHAVDGVSKRQHCYQVLACYLTGDDGGSEISECLKVFLFKGHLMPPSLMNAMLMSSHLLNSTMESVQRKER